MLRSLYSRLAVVLVLVLGALGVLALAVTSHTTMRYQQEVTQKLNQDLARHIAREVPLMRGGRVDRARLRELFHQLMMFNPGIELYLLDLDGRILAHSAPAGRVQRRAVDLTPVRRFLERPSALPVLGDDPRADAGHKVFSAAPLRSEQGEEGYLYVILGGEDYDSVVHRLRDSYTLQQTGWVLGLSLALALAAGLALFRWLTRRLRRLAGAIEAFEREGDPQAASTPGAARDEIDRLSETFGRMALRIREQMDRLRSTDELRRDLVANVSHDLRTPLATLQGCIETALLKEETLGPEERRDYLRLALRHCRRLDRLVHDLFELARLDAIDTVPQPEAFPLAELVQDVVQKFRLAGAQRGVTVAARVSERLPFVRADIALVERVLENLIENALRHTPDGGRVEVRLDLLGERIRVQVRDTGCGIAQGELPRIFERSYQVDKSRSAGAETSGLGLTIVKRILDLHDSPIEVRSMVNQGTTFEFGLPVAPGGA